MGKKGGKGKKGKGPNPLDAAESAVCFKDNYVRYSKAIDIVPSPIVLAQLEEEALAEGLYKTGVLALHDGKVDGETGRPAQVHCGGLRALATALLGTGEGMCGVDDSGAVDRKQPAKPFKLCTTLRVWAQPVRNDGACAVAEVLRLGGADCPLVHLEMISCGIGPRGCLALGRSLKFLENRSLLGLRLDGNEICDDGCEALCRGLRTNCTLLKLHLRGCGLTAGAAPHLARMLRWPQLALSTLDLERNTLGNAGLATLCAKNGLAANKSVTELRLADNRIDGRLDGIAEACDALSSVLEQPLPPLAKIDLMYNRIGLVGAEALLRGRRAAENRLELFLPDAHLPGEVFEALALLAGGKKKGKKGKK